jgi:hypothetical protein
VHSNAAQSWAGHAVRELGPTQHSVVENFSSGYLRVQPTSCMLDVIGHAVREIGLIQYSVVEIAHVI